MNDKYAKEIAKELRLIRIELQKENNPRPEGVYADGMTVEETKRAMAGDGVTIKKGGGTSNG